MALDPRAGHQSVTIEIDGERANLIENEAGGHRLQRIPPTERNGRVHSSTVTVAVISENTKETVYDRRQDSDFEISWFSGTGCGGQHRNKHQNSCRLKHLPTGVVTTAQTRSRASSLQNAKEALCAELDRQKALATTDSDRAIRKDQVGTGERSDKRRTIRFQADQVVDHITGKRMNAADYMKGNMDKLW